MLPLVRRSKSIDPRPTLPQGLGVRLRPLGTSPLLKHATLRPGSCLRVCQPSTHYVVPRHLSLRFAQRPVEAPSSTVKDSERLPRLYSAGFRSK